ncbi:aspartyl-phosphate phosphatase Spo0E family protein [Desulfosporosinus sp.]|uniref:aspartyl-phosphate phosphatase Spo0E family protein n=1 Tax=Desulfosporosinus sp. TaxID=157907 RepID=UPI000E8D2783|nr:aspartyl-phosphate phosphatase Spo0E family protein [Desulfosporosinus sp.]MBC2721112.1 aspartyl-phosphate phosphatase Spo0E family protein [Desulfosporosinus sp.]MBC2725565.1 aspartyl-phosphate phosphatase Spo0E family protein [Desulfosporosinus sp.]HBV88171.1 aspartyl-phosphate phosphatase Spo0E family protein [Desulfosporosinus sp.]
MEQLIDQQIEELRLEMHEVASDKNLTDYRVVSISCKLDALINEFYVMKRLKISS